MESRRCSDAEEISSSRDRMLELASSLCNELQPLSINCNMTRLRDEVVENIPLLRVCSSPLIDFGTYIEELSKDLVFPVVRRDMSYSVEVLCNNGTFAEAGSSQGPPNVNPFAPVNSIRRPVRQRIEAAQNQPEAYLEFDIYNDIPNLPSDEMINFEPIRTPSVTSSRLSDYEDFNVLESNPGYVQLDPSMPQIDSNNFQLPSEGDILERQYPHTEHYSSMPLEITEIDPNVPSQSTIRTVSFMPPLVPYTDSISPIIPDLVTESTPILINLPILYIIPIIPLSIQPVFLAPIQPSTFTYLPAPLAFNCVLRTPFPQFIYSVEPCRDPGCPFSYRYRCPTPQIEPSEQPQRRRTTACHFRRSDRFNYSCSNRLEDDFEDDTPKRNNENAPPPKRRLSDKFESPRQPIAPPQPSTSTATTTSTIETLTTRLDNIKLNGDTVSRMSQISVQISSRNENYRKRRSFTRTSHTVEIRRNERTEFTKRRFNKPRNMSFVRPSLEPEPIEMIKSTIIRKLNLDRTMNWTERLKMHQFDKIKNFTTSRSSLPVERPYFLNLIRSKFYEM